MKADALPDNRMPAEWLNAPATVAADSAVTAAATLTGPAAPAPHHKAGWTPERPARGAGPMAPAPAHPLGWTPGLPLQDPLGPAAATPLHPVNWVPDGLHGPG
jgi:hypothetical protein